MLKLVNILRSDDIAAAHFLHAFVCMFSQADFGLARQRDAYAESDMTVAGTSFYQAPEVVHGKYSTTVDVWSIGVVLLQLMVLG